MNGAIVQTRGREFFVRIVGAIKMINRIIFTKGKGKKKMAEERPRVDIRCAGCLFYNGTDCFRGLPGGLAMMLHSGNDGKVIPKATYPDCKDEVAEKEKGGV